MKRLFDIIFSSVVLIIFSPFALIIMLILRLTGEGEIFYLQKRIGKNKEKFNLIKFATMLKESPNLGAGDITLKNDPRVLPFGRFLRKTKLNEMPQFINVLKGDMSIVGPRPLTEKNFSYYNKKQQEVISSLKPGITGIASIEFRDEEKIISESDLNYEECYKKEIIPLKAELGKWYKENNNFWIDIKVVIITAMIVIFPDLNYKKYFTGLPEKD